MDDYKTYLLIKDFEVFVDDISNWYIRTNRRRFWKTEDEKDKMTAYYTLFFALNTCVKVMAPIIPFMTEHIWQELTRKVLPSSAISVHLSGWPKEMEGFEDDGIIEQTALARDVIAVAMRLRNEHQLKVRQPLAKLFVCCDDDTANKLKAFEKNILDELNIKNIEYIKDKSVLEDSYLTVNFKAAGAVLKQNVNKFKQSLENAGKDEMAAMAASVAAGEKVSVPGWDEEFDPSLFQMNYKTKEGIVSAECSDDITAALDVVITEELKKEGIVRDAVRQCQLLRKEAGYQVEQRIVIAINSSHDFVMSALKEKADHIASELLANEVIFGALDGADMSKEAEAAGEKIEISVKKA